MTASTFQPLHALGLMSGTSMDGIDVALLTSDGEAHVVQGPTHFFPYSPADRAVLRAALVAAMALDTREARPGVLAHAEALVTTRHAEAVQAFFGTHRLRHTDVDLIGFHGQTVLHRPAQRLTVQVGDGGGLAQTLGVPVVYDFRAADVAAGGQGAPLVPVFHAALVRSAGLLSKGDVAVVNIGGVANVTVVTADGSPPMACDTGPGNALIDDLMLACIGVPVDQDGATAAQGQVNEAALADLLNHPYFAKPAPKSLDRNAFASAPVAHLSTVDAAATLTAFTAQTIAEAVAQMAQVATLVVCGGGTRNPVLMEALAERSGKQVVLADALGWSADFMEAQAFAYLAVRHLRRLPQTYPSTTGVSRPWPGGIVCHPVLQG